MRGQDVLVVVDLTEVNRFPGSVEFDSLQIQVLKLFNHLLNNVRISSFLALSSWCSPVDLRREGLCLFSDSNASARALIGAILQAIVQVFRRESGLHFDAWCLDLLNPDTLHQDCLNELIANEIHAQQSSRMLMAWFAIGKTHRNNHIVACSYSTAVSSCSSGLPYQYHNYYWPRSNWCQFGHCPDQGWCQSCCFLGRRSGDNVHVSYSSYI